MPSPPPSPPTFPALSEQWPTNSPANLYLAPANSLDADFEAERERLFVPDDEVNISIIEIRPATAGDAPGQRQPQRNKQDFDNTEDVLQYVREREGKDTNGETTIVYVTLLSLFALDFLHIFLFVHSHLSTSIGVHKQPS